MRIGLQTWGSEGDVQLFIALAAGLAKEGHEVCLVASDSTERDWSPLGAQLGFKVIHARVPSRLSPAEFERAWREIVDGGNPIRQAESLLRLGFDPVADLMYEEAIKLCESSDVVIGHFFVFPLRVAAEKTGTPLATLNAVHNCLPSAQICPLGFPDLGRWSYPLGWMLVRKLLNKAFLPRVNALRKREGLPPNKDLLSEVWTSDKLNIVAVSPSICTAPSDWAGQHSVSGFLNLPVRDSLESPPPGLEEFIAAGDPPIYFTFGSMLIPSLDYIQEALAIWNQTVKLLDRRAIFQLPWDDLGVFATDDSRVFKVKRSPYKLIFPKCAVIVHHGGAGTTQSSLLAGCPSVVVAHLGDQFFWGSELERLGVAGPTRKRKRLKAAELARSITEVLNSPGMTQRAQALGAAMQQERGVDIAVGLVVDKLLPHAGV